MTKVFPYNSVGLILESGFKI